MGTIWSVLKLTTGAILFSGTKAQCRAYVKHHACTFVSIVEPWEVENV